MQGRDGRTSATKSPYQRPTVAGDAVHLVARRQEFPPMPPVAARPEVSSNSRLGLSMVVLGLILNIVLVVLLLGDAVRPGHISLTAIALMATVGGALLVAGLAVADNGPHGRR